MKLTESGNPEDVINVPNIISASRLGLAALLMVLIPQKLYIAALVVFLLAAGTDWIDGWWARRFRQVTHVGRILDSFCDKIVILGTFILLVEAMTGKFPWFARITGWMATIVLAREMLVTALRSFVETSGGDFSAKLAGKLKFVIQCVTAGLCLLALVEHNRTGGKVPPAVLWMTSIAIWLTLISTLWSGLGYVTAAARFIGDAARTTKAENAGDSP